MKRLLFFMPLMAIMIILGISSCVGTVENSTSVSIDTTAVENTTVVDSIAEEPSEFLGGRTPWEEFTIESKNYGYANVREFTSKDAPVVKEIKTGEHFYGWRMPDNPDWIEVYDNKGNTIGYMYYYCARHTGNKSEDSDISDNEYDNDTYSERSSDTWPGASSVEELRQKIEGTYWHGKNDLFIYQLHFYDGKISMKVAQRGHWGDEYVYTGYDVIRHSTNNGDFLELKFEVDENEKLENRGFSISFVKKCMIVTLHQFGDPECLLHYGKYEINHDL